MFLIEVLNYFSILIFLWCVNNFTDFYITAYVNLQLPEVYSATYSTLTYNDIVNRVNLN